MVELNEVPIILEETLATPEIHDLISMIIERQDILISTLLVAIVVSATFLVCFILYKSLKVFI